MLIFLIPSGYPSDRMPTSGIFISEQRKELEQCGHTVVVLDASAYNYRFWSDAACEEPQKLKSQYGCGYVWHVRGILQSKLPRLAIWQHNLKIKKLYAMAKSDYGTPDLILAHFTFPGGFNACKIAAAEGIPCVVIEHYSLFFNDSYNPVISNILKYAINTSDAFICVSNALRDSILNKTQLRREIQVIPNMVDRRFIYSAPTQHEGFRFFSAGNLTENKRFDLLIEAFCSAFSSGDAVTLQIAGVGEDEGNLKSIIQNKNRTHQIHMHGQLSRDEMQAMYRDCDCFILLSRRETFGVVYREALATGRPVIATNNGGIAEGWAEDFGILVDIDDVDGAAVAIKKMRCNYNLYNYAAISEKCLGMFSADNVIGLLNEVLYEAVQARSK